MFKKIANKMRPHGPIYHYTAHFKTTDGCEHTFTKYRYMNAAILYSAPEYIMIDVKSAGYMKDDDGVMYPLQNVISIWWECDGKIDNVPLHEYQVFYDEEDYE